MRHVTMKWGTQLGLVVAIALLLIGVVRVEGDPPQSDLTSKPNSIDQDANVASPDKVNPDTSDSDTGIVSKTFRPPGSWSFRIFKDEEKKPGAIYPQHERIDLILSTGWTLQQGFSEADSAINVPVKTTAWETADSWPIKADGNLKGGSGGSGGQGGETPHWAAQVSQLTVELDIREGGQVENRVGRDDPRSPTSARNKSVVWHNAQSNSITFDVIKPPNITDPFRIRIEDQSGTNPSLPLDYELTADSNSHTLNIASDAVTRDIIVKYGLDTNHNGSLDNDEVKSSYEIYGVSPTDYSDARGKLNDALWGLTKIADALVKRFKDGTWPSGHDYAPDSVVSTVKLSADALTHNFGGAFSEPGFVRLNNRDYFKASVTLAIYKYDKDSDASELVRGDSRFETGIDNWISKLDYATLHAAYVANPQPGPTKTVAFNDVIASFSFGATGSIGLGGCSSTGGAILLTVTPAGGNYSIDEGCQVANLIVQDVFDYNYFNPAGTFHEASISAASVQCGFGKTGAFHAKAGEVGVVRIEVHGDVDTSGHVIKP